jgi:hypothetical protein
MNNQLKSDSGYALGLVLIFVLGVGTVLGSVLMMTQVSADAQGRGVDQLKVANSNATQNAEDIRTLIQVSSDNYVASITPTPPNCGLPSSEAGISISCEVVPDSDPSKGSMEKVLFTSPDKLVVERDFVTSIDPVSHVSTVSEAVSHHAG